VRRVREEGHLLLIILHRNYDAVPMEAIMSEHDVDSQPAGRPTQFTYPPAVPLTADMFLAAPFMQGQDMQPSCLRMNVPAYRVSLLGMIVLSQDGAAILDDGTGSVPLRGLSFEPKVGDILNVIGRPREFGARHCSVEIMKVLGDARWIKVHRAKAQLLRMRPGEAPPPEPAQVIPDEVREAASVPPESLDMGEAVLAAIRKLDKGEGASLTDVVAAAVGADHSSTKAAEAEQAVTDLTNAGEIFELAPGRLKVLE